MQVFYSLISSLKTNHPTLHFTPWSLDLFIHVPFQLPGEHTVSAHWTYRTHCHLCPTRYSFSPEPIKHWRVKCLTQDWEVGEAWYFSENPAPSGIRNRTAGIDIGRAPLSNHCAMSLSTIYRRFRIGRLTIWIYSKPWTRIRALVHRGFCLIMCLRHQTHEYIHLRLAQCWVSVAQHQTDLRWTFGTGAIKANTRCWPDVGLWWASIEASLGRCLFSWVATVNMILCANVALMLGQCPSSLTLKALRYFYINQETNGVFFNFKSS